MHKKLPYWFIFLDQYNKELFENNYSNIGIIYRNYNNPKRESDLIKVAKFCKKKRYKLFVSNDLKLAIKVKAEGLYVPAFNRVKKFSNLENRNLIIIGSAHNQKEINEKILQKCTSIFLSPIFFVKKQKKFLEVHKFNLLTRNNKIQFLALGGIRNSNLLKLKLLNANGFGGIEYFKKKPAFKRPVF